MNGERGRIDDFGRVVVEAVLLQREKPSEEPSFIFLEPIRSFIRALLDSFRSDYAEGDKKWAAWLAVLVRTIWDLLCQLERDSARAGKSNSRAESFFLLGLVIAPHEDDEERVAGLPIVDVLWTLAPVLFRYEPEVAAFVDGFRLPDNGLLKNPSWILESSDIEESDGDEYEFGVVALMRFEWCLSWGTDRRLGEGP